MKLITVKEMQEIEKEADKMGHSYQDMMSCAGHGLGVWVDETFGEDELRTVIGLVGAGNNGGDTIVALDYLQSRGWYAYAYLVKPRDEGDRLIDQFTQHGGILLKAAEDSDFQALEEHLQQSSVLLDGVLGTGIKLPLKPDVARVLQWVKNFLFAYEAVSNPLCDVRVVCHPHVIAVDCPSGVDCDSGEAAAECLPAEATLCMSAVKTGLVKFPAFQWVGRLVTVDIGLPENLTAEKQIKRQVVDREMVKAILPPREMTAHKGTFGTVMAVVGSINYPGAAGLAGKAAYRIGAGLVTLAVPQPVYTILAGQFPEATWLLISHSGGVISPGAVNIIRKNLTHVTALLLGSGWGIENETLNFLIRLLNAQSASHPAGVGFIPQPTPTAKEPQRINLPPMVIDADGLKLLARISNWHQYLPALSILTPHPGEMSVLTSLPVEAIQSDRMAMAENYAQKWGHVVVLKGALTIIASPDGQSALVPVATSALARAGTGDVLAGIITGLRAQGVGAFEAALAGAWLHAQAGLNAAEIMGNTASVLAGDVLNSLPRVISQLND